MNNERKWDIKMKFKNVLGAMIFATTLACGATSVFAAGETFEIGTPINLDNLTEVTELEAGQVVAFPVDIITDQGIVSMGYGTTCNTDILTPGVADAELTDTQYDNAGSLGEILADAADSSKDMAIFAIGESGRKGFTAYGYPGVTVGKINWADAYTRTVTDKPEFYLIYKVNKSVSLDELNISLIEPRDGQCVVGVDNVGSTLEKTPNSAKANACDGAFKVVVDGSSLPYWVQGVKANGIALDACINADGTTEYSFPVRVNVADATKTSVDVTITATVTDDEAGTKNSREVTWGTVNVNVEGTATGYTAASGLNTSAE